MWPLTAESGSERGISVEGDLGYTFADFESDIAPVNRVHGRWGECHVL